MPARDAFPERSSPYEAGHEMDRLARDIGPLELARSQDILRRFLLAAPATICDVDGGPGVYSFLDGGAQPAIHLVDIAPLHIDQARAGCAAGSADAGEPRTRRRAGSTAVK
jgi:hypothetical protein